MSLAINSETSWSKQSSFLRPTLNLFLQLHSRWKNRQMNSLEIKVEHVKNYSKYNQIFMKCLYVGAYPGHNIGSMA